MKPIGEISEEEIAERLEKIRGRAWADWAKPCGKDLDTVSKQARICRTVLLMVLEAKEGWMSEPVKEEIRRRKKEMERAAQNLKETVAQLRTLAGRTLIGRPTSPDESTERTLVGMELVAESLRAKSLTILPFLKREGQKDGVDFLLRTILKRNANFNCWNAFSRVLKEAGVHITASGLRAKRDQYFAENPPGDDGPKGRMT